MINPVNPDTIYVATFGAGVYRSDDGGDTWSSASSGLDNSYVTSLVIDPAAPQTLYAGTSRAATNEPHVFRTEDGGETWTQVTSAHHRLEWLFNEVTSLAVAPQGLYMGSQAVYRYRDGDWEQISEGFLGNGFINVALDPGDQNVLYAGTYQGGLFRSDDDGITWQSIAWETFAGSINVRIAVDPNNSARLLASGHGVLLRSEDRGVSWSVVLWGDIETIVFDSLNPGQVWAGSRRGLWVSYDAGASWERIAEFEGIHVHSLALNPTSAGAIFVGTHKRGLFRSRDGGQSWEATNRGIANTLVSALAADSRSPERLYVGTLGDGLFVTEDLGVTWNHIGGELTGAFVQTLLVHPVQPHNVFAGTWDGLFISHDRGQTWARAGVPLAGKQVIALTTSSGTGNLYAGTHGDGLFVSRDGGTTWAALEGPDRYVTALLVEPSDPQLVYAGTLSGVYRSNNGGTTWEAVSEGLRDLNVRAMSLGVELGSLYIATGDAIYVSHDYGASWDRRSDVLGFDYFRAVSGGEAVLAASWNGVFFSKPGDFGWTTYTAGFLNPRVTSLARAGDRFIAGIYGGGAYAFLPACRPLWGRVTDSSGEPVFARLVTEPGSYVTFSGTDGWYAFENLPSGRYQLTVRPVNQDRGTSVEVDLQTSLSARLELVVSVDLAIDSMPLALLGGPPLPSGDEPPRYPALLSGEMLPLTVRALLPGGLPSSASVIWTSDLDGHLGSTSVNDRGTAHIDVRLDSIGHHTITAEVIADGVMVGQVTTRVEVQDPRNLNAIGMAWDGEYLWVTHEPSDTGELGRIYQLSVLDDHLAVVNSYPHPAPAPDSIAWDGNTIWTGGHEGPDPYRSWEAGTFYLYRHSMDRGLPVVERYASTDDFAIAAMGLTWDGEHLWGSRDDRIVRYEQTDEGLTIAAQYSGPGNQIRTVEWVGNNLWAFDSQSNRLFKLDVEVTLMVQGSCEPGMIGSYGMAWDGTGFWLWTLEDPKLRYISPSPDCPLP